MKTLIVLVASLMRIERNDFLKTKFCRWLPKSRNVDNNESLSFSVDSALFDTLNAVCEVYPEQQTFNYELLFKNMLNSTVSILRTEIFSSAIEEPLDLLHDVDTTIILTNDMELSSNISIYIGVMEQLLEILPIWRERSLYVVGMRNFIEAMELGLDPLNQAIYHRVFNNHSYPGRNTVPGSVSIEQVSISNNNSMECDADFDVQIQMDFIAIKQKYPLGRDGFAQSWLPDFCVEKKSRCTEYYETSTLLTTSDTAVLNHIRLANHATNNKTSSCRILCMSYTYSPNHEAVRIIASSWGSQCDGYLAFSNETDLSIPTLNIMHGSEVAESYYAMWTKVQRIWKFVARYLANDFDFFLLGGDDLFVIVNNLRSLLNSEQIRRIPLAYFGRPMRKNRYFSFNSGGSGYILNRAAALLLVSHIDQPYCMPSIITSMEDVMVAQCFMQISPHAVINQILDDEGRNLFHPLDPGDSFENELEWYRNMSVSSKGGLDCCSQYSVSFHYIKPPKYDMACMHYKIHC